MATSRRFADEPPAPPPTVCGIAGTLDPAPHPGARARVARMCTALAHRGPDAEGVKVQGPAVLGQRRLSIIDLSADGNQPLTNEDGSIWLVVNGEIYNHLDLRRGLEAAGHRFRSRSDSEVLLHLYEQEGDAFVGKLRGMFAFALWDGRRRRLLCGRDRLGKKPFYWTFARQRLSFASELPALIAGLDERPPPDLGAIDRYLSLQYVPAPLTAYQGIEKLPPAHLLIAEPRQAPRLERYWRLSFVPRGRAVSVEDAVAETRALLEESVRLRQLAADVPVGAFLSGGVDSSAVVGLMATQVSTPIKTFSIDFPGTSGEVAYARLVARRYETDHHEMKVEPDMISVLPELVSRYGEPFADTSAVPVYYLSKMTRSHVRVALSGDGGDETFAGYRRYLWHGLSRQARRLPAPAWRALGQLFGNLRAARARPFRQWGRMLGRSSAERYLSLIAHFDPDAKARILGPALRPLNAGGDVVLADFEARFAESSARDDVNRLLGVDTETYLPDDILTKVDVASMAWALEVRAPLLDHVLMEHMASLPGALKLHGLRGKRLLRAAVADLVPKAILTRKKKGFSLPVDGWFRGELRPMARDLLLDKTCRERGLVDAAAVAALLDEQDAGADHGERLWNLLVLEIWFRQLGAPTTAPRAGTTPQAGTTSVAPPPMLAAGAPSAAPPSGPAAGKDDVRPAG